MSERISFAAVKHDALLAVDGEADGYQLSQGQEDDAVLALVNAVEAAHAFETSDVLQCADPDGCSGCKLNAALARFDFEATV